MNPLVGNSHQGASLSHCRLSEAPFWLLLHQQHKGDSSCRYLLKCMYFLTRWPGRTSAWLVMCTMLLQPGRKSRPACEPRYKRHCVFHVNVGRNEKRRASAFVRWFFSNVFRSALLDYSSNISTAIRTNADQQQISGFDYAGKIGDRDRVTTFTAPDIGEQHFSGVGWNSCPQLGCGFSKFWDRFSGHGKLYKISLSVAVNFGAWRTKKSLFANCHCCVNSRIR